MNSPICNVTRGEVVEHYPMYWNPKAFLVGTHSDWHGQWQVDIPGDDLTSEIINFHLCEGDNRGDIRGDGDEADEVVASWDVVGDLSPPREADRTLVPASRAMRDPILKIQEIPFDDPESRYMFRPGPEKQFVATPAALAMYGEAICRCLTKLQALAAKKNGLDYFQVFDDPDRPESLWFMEDGCAITAILPSDH